MKINMKNRLAKLMTHRFLWWSVRPFLRRSFRKLIEVESQKMLAYMRGKCGTDIEMVIMPIAGNVAYIHFIKPGPPKRRASVAISIKDAWISGIKDTIYELFYQYCEVAAITLASYD